MGRVIHRERKLRELFQNFTFGEIEGNVLMILQENNREE